jgi:hypothetical protein
LEKKKKGMMMKISTATLTQRGSDQREYPHIQFWILNNISMAGHMTRLILWKLICHFDMEVCAESKDWFSGQRAWTAWAMPPLSLNLAPVGSAPE